MQLKLIKNHDFREDYSCYMLLLSVFYNHYGYYLYIHGCPFLQSTQVGNQVNLTCSDTGKSNIYPLYAADNLIKLDDLCSEFCS